jgi:hypothetical protein
VVCLDERPRKADKTDPSRTDRDAQVSRRVSSAANGKISSDGRDRGATFTHRDRDGVRDRDRDVDRSDRSAPVRAVVEDRR